LEKDFYLGAPGDKYILNYIIHEPWKAQGI
jgi:hypothetical protein